MAAKDRAPTASPCDQELQITRSFDAPRALVFAAWTEPEHLARWSGPEGFTIIPDQSDIREGGAYRTCLRSPEGTDHWVRGVYRDISAPARLVFTHQWEDEGGRPGPQTVVTVTFAEQGAATTLMTFHQAFFDSVASRDGHREGWSSSFDGLAKHLARVAA